MPTHQSYSPRVHIGGTKQLIQDLKEKYNLDYLKEKHIIAFANMNELSEGNVSVKLLKLLL